MSEHPRQLLSPETAERAVVLQLLRDDHDERWSYAELQAAVSDLEPSALTSALERLEQHGVVARRDEYVLASRCSRRLDDLSLVGV
jgi:DNA-binding HxlR family transcriptional regulator